MTNFLFILFSFLSCSFLCWLSFLHFSWMSWSMRHRSRTICLSLAFVTIFFHLLLALVSLSIRHLPCDAPLPPRTHVLRDLAHANTSKGIRENSELSAGNIKREASYEDGEKDLKSNAFPSQTVPVKGNKNTIPLQMAKGRHGNESLESDLLKLKALFDHPLYNMPMPAVPEDDWLLTVKPKVKKRARSSQMWSVWWIIM